MAVPTSASPVLRELLIDLVFNAIDKQSGKDGFFFNIVAGALQDAAHPDVPTEAAAEAAAQWLHSQVQDALSELVPVWTAALSGIDYAIITTLNLRDVEVDASDNLDVRISFDFEQRDDSITREEGDDTRLAALSLIAKADTYTKPSAQERPTWRVYAPPEYSAFLRYEDNSGNDSDESQDTVTGAT